MPLADSARAAPAPQPRGASSPRTSRSSPSKRTYRSSPTASPRAGSDAEAVSPRVLRTRLSNVAGELSVEERLTGGRDRATASSAQGDVDVDSIIPNTPPEAALEALVGLGVAIPGADRLAELAKDDVDAHDGSTQMATAERQMQEYENMSDGEMHWALASMCSQHVYSEYNQLKQTIAAAAEAPTAGVAGFATLSARATLPTEPQPQAAAPSVAIPNAASVENASQVVDDAAPASGPIRTSASPSLPARSVTTPAKETAASSSSQTTLTPSLTTFQFASVSTTTSSCAPASPTRADTESTRIVEGLLDDLVSGEPVSPQQSESTVVISETIPSADAGLVVDEPPPVPGLLPGIRVHNGVPVKTSISHPINISPLVPPELLPHLSTQLKGLTLTDEAQDTTFFGDLVRPSPQTDLLTLCATLRTDPFAFPYKQAGAPSLGNFVLSSCPGKKVRMNGEPIRNGRGAICRDVVLDLRRARDEYGVGLVVCCIDDRELAILGVPWEEYHAAARLLGLEVVRIPMVEGFAPDSPESLDVHLARIVRDYTLRGKSVLAHCRGGIGRAGLVASCWMLKMGLVAGQSALPSNGDSLDVPFEDEDPMGIVERVIELIRRRRSVKAIETPYQVRFLHQYITSLQQKHAAASRDASPH